MKLMLLLEYAERRCAKQAQSRGQACIAWTNDGKAFVIADQDELVNSFLPSIFPRTKYSSFTRKLYRWGFRQLGLTANKRESGRKKIFGHDLFQRENKQLIVHMQSTTAEGARRGSSSHSTAVTVTTLQPQRASIVSGSELITSASRPVAELLNAAVPNSTSTNLGWQREDILTSLLAANMRSNQLLAPSMAASTMPNALQHLVASTDIAAPHELLTSASLAASVYPGRLDLAALLNYPTHSWGANTLLQPPHLNNTSLYPQLQSGPSVALTNPLLPTYLNRPNPLPPTIETAQFNRIMGTMKGYSWTPFGSLEDSTQINTHSSRDANGGGI